MVENCGTAHALRQSLPDQVFSGSGGLNIFNHEAVRHLSSRFGMVTLSTELSHDEIRLLILTARLQGSPALFGLIEDRVRCNGKGGETDVANILRADGECRSHIYNSSEICLSTISALMQIGINATYRYTRQDRDLYRYDPSLPGGGMLAEKGVRTDPE
jgi:hypothetical protein